MKRLNLSHETETLRDILLKNPDLPLLVFASENANSGDWSNMVCTSIDAYVGEFLDCDSPVGNGEVFLDRQDFEDTLSDFLYSGFDGTEKEFEFNLEDALKAYEPYWTPAIILYVDN